VRLYNGAAAPLAYGKPKDTAEHVGLRTSL
jgi:hypothetical protein